MELEYKWNKKDLKKELLKKRKTTNIVFMLLGMLLYIFLMFNGIKSKIFDNKIILLYGLIYLSVLTIILFISTKIYVALSLRKNDKKTNKAYGIYKVKVDNDSISISINSDSICYKYKDITKYKKHKDYFFICTSDDKIGLTFKKKVIGEDKYKELIEYLNHKVK